MRTIQGVQERFSFLELLCAFELMASLSHSEKNSKFIFFAVKRKVLTFLLKHEITWSENRKIWKQGRGGTGWEVNKEKPPCLVGLYLGFNCKCSFNCILFREENPRCRESSWSQKDARRNRRRSWRRKLRRIASDWYNRRSHRSFHWKYWWV